MAPVIPSAELRLSYPLYAVDFDPQDADRLVVGGGGGAARSGVGNKVSVLDASREDSIQTVSEIELSSDEDSVNTIAVGPRTKSSVLLCAGINSAHADLKKGKNEHFRIFAADLPSKTKAGASDPKIVEVSRTALFSATDADTYQRLLRVSDQVGAVATGTTGRVDKAQIAIFDMPSADSNAPTPTQRGRLQLAKEAMDMDLLKISDDEHQLLYCNDYDINILNITKTPTDPYCVFTMPHDESTGAKDRPSLRCIRYLTPTFVLAVSNLPKAGGAVLQVFRLPKPSDLGKPDKEGKARLALAVHLPKSVSRATGLAVRNLSPPPTPAAKQGSTEFVLAVTGQDSSITILTLQHQTVANVNLVTKLHPVTTLKQVHLGPISGLAFSPVSTPPPSSPSPSTPRPQTLKLASIGSMANTVVVHTLPLRPLSETTTTNTTTANRRYVLALKSSPPSNTALLIGFGLAFALLAVLLHGILEVQGLARPLVGARHVTPVRWQRAYAGTPSLPHLLPPPSVATAAAAAATGAAELGGVWEKYGAMGAERVVLNAPSQDGDGVEVEGHDAARHGEAKGWEEMKADQQAAWKERLKRAGHWGEEMGEAVFKGVLFGEIGGMVGAMVR
ncbi:hypothetical protein BT67DRAFT_414674 [Trichocladium antarcticum]|uniref:Guanine nucleotide-exchange factor SEC12 n=1 Tax=Trichocladium antarcticum TaxID=1450529 RepID=A0AAN6UT44_9PEZI|nr:hypothetical protein BT67DRAFT_414674 [Trichocladium antarcticum]